MSERSGEKVPVTQREVAPAPVEETASSTRRWLPPCMNCGRGVHAVYQGGCWAWVHYVWEADEYCGAPVPPAVAVAEATDG